MKAIILAAGYATRLYPLTKDMPKALLPVCGKPIIDYIVDEINTLDDVDSIFVISNDVFYKQFLDWKDTVISKKDIFLLNDKTRNNETRLGAIGDISLCIDTFNIDDDVLIVAGDNLFNFSLKDFYESYKIKNLDSVCVKKIDNKNELKNFAVASLDDNDIILNLVEKPENPMSDIAVFATYIYKKDTIKLFKEYLYNGNNKDAPGHFLEYLYKFKNVYGYKFSGDCFDIGTLEAYENVKDTFDTL